MNKNPRCHPLCLSLTTLLLIAADLYIAPGAALAGDSWDRRFVPAPETDGEIIAIAVAASDVYVGGEFSNVGGVRANNIARWNGTTWEPLGDGTDGKVQTIAVNGTNIYVGGAFSSANGIQVTNLAKWNGSTWSAFGSAEDEQGEAFVSSIVISGTNIFIGGSFTAAGGVNATNVARFNGTTWSGLGRGIHYRPADTNDTAVASVNALAVSGTNLYVGGFFNLAGAVNATNIARWNITASTWSALGAGVNYISDDPDDLAIAEVTALAVSGTNLFVGGTFNRAGSLSASAVNFAKWDGVAWSFVGGAADGAVQSIAVSGTNIYIGGSFISVDSVQASRVARWNGYNWQQVGSGIEGDEVSVIALTASDLWAAGSFDGAAGLPAQNVARWNGINWSAVPNSLGNAPSGPLHGLAVQGTNVFVCGQFKTAGSAIAANVAQWNGTSWLPLSSGISSGENDDVIAVAASGSGIYFGGSFTAAGGVQATNIACWNGTTWTALGSGITLAEDPTMAKVLALAVGGTNVFAGGLFNSAGGITASNIAMWNGTMWQPLGPGIQGPVYALAFDGTNLFAGGDFESAGGLAARYIARWDGLQWSPVGLGFNGAVRALAVAGGTLYAGGDFINAEGTPANHVAQWNGSKWLTLATGLENADSVYGLAVSGTNLFVTGSFYGADTNVLSNVARWDGSSWTRLGSGLDAAGYAIAAIGTDICVGGAFARAGEAPSSHVGIWHDALPHILQNPDPPLNIVAPGTDLAFDVVALGTAPLSYQWRLNGTNIAGATTTHLSRTNISAQSCGFYTVFVSNSFGTAISEPAVVQLESAAVFTDDFETGMGQWTSIGGGATVPTAATARSHGGTNSAYCDLTKDKAYHNLGIELVGHTRATFWVYDDNVAGARWFGEACGYTGAGYGTGTLQQILAIGRYSTDFGTNNTGDLQGETVVTTNYQGRVYSGTSSGYFNLSDSTDTAGRSLGWHCFQIERSEDNSTVAFLADGQIQRTIYETTNAPWDCVTIGSLGSGTTANTAWFDDVRVEYFDPPSITIQPVNRTVNKGANATFTVTVSGNAPTYQWFRNGVAIAGATASSVTATNAQTNAVYSVMVANGVGATISEDALLLLNTAPQILIQPQGRTAAAGTDVLLSVTATGTPSQLFYQWRRNGTNLAGATASELVLLNAQTNQSGPYSVVITNTAGATTSSVATVSITNAAPVILIPPQSQAIDLGANVSFNVVASGSDPKTFQWRLNGTNIPAATLTSYRRTNLQPADAGNYSVAISNSFGGVISPTATLTLNYPPSITVQPQGATVYAGTNVTFSVGVTGTPPFTYEWFRNGVSLSFGGEDTDTLTLYDVQSADAATYSVQISNMAGRTNSAGAVLVVYGPPSILTGPEDQRAGHGSNATFTVEAVGYGALHYQWRFFGTNLPGATGSSCTITNVSTSNLGFYSVTVTNAYGATPSDPASLMLDSCIVFRDGFESGLGNWLPVPGGATRLTNGNSFVHTGTNSALCNNSLNQMYHPLGIELEGHRRATFWIYDDEGSQTRWFGEIRAYEAGFGTNVEQVLALGRYDLDFPDGQTGELQGESVDPFSYQGRLLSGASSGYFNLSGFDVPQRSSGWHKFEIEQSDDGSTTDFYLDGIPARTIDTVTPTTWDSVVIGSVGAEDVAGNVWFDDVLVEYLDPPVIVADPESQMANAGTDATFSAQARGNVQSYQWRFNGTNLSGATSSSFTVHNVQATNAGLYSVAVFNGVGVTLSADAELTVLFPPTILMQPASQTVNRGSNALFVVTAEGTLPLSYQWRWNGTNILGATDSACTRTNVQFIDAGTYSVVVTNTAGSVTSQDAILAVRNPQPPQFGTASISGSQFQLQLSADPASTCEIQTSINLTNWTTITNAALTNGSLLMLEPLTNSRRFYRAIVY